MLSMNKRWVNFLSLSNVLFLTKSPHKRGVILSENCNNCSSVLMCYGKRSPISHPYLQTFFFFFWPERGYWKNQDQSKFLNFYFVCADISISTQGFLLIGWIFFFPPVVLGKIQNWILIWMLSWVRIPFSIAHSVFLFISAFFFVLFHSC